MRLILNTVIIILLSTLSAEKVASQTQNDTIDLSETFLEERHLRYMYNFALNGKFFQYRSIPDHIVTRGKVKNTNQNEIVFIVNEKFPIRIEELELFVQSDSLQEVKFVNNLNHRMEVVGFTSQFDFDYLKIDDQKNITYFIQEKLIENPEMNYAIQFSNFFIRGNKIYLSVRMHYYVNYNPDNIFDDYQMYEFEWCESMGWVYPKRVSSPTFGLVISNKVQLGGTINIPSLKCP